MPIPTKCALFGGGFSDAAGNVLKNGYLRMFLSQDANVPGVGNVCSGIYVQIALDINGNVVTNPAQAIWGNDVLVPTNTFYRVFGYTASGQLAFGPNNQQVIGSSFDVGTWIPNQVISWQPPLQPLILQTNEVNNGSQTLLDLHAGSGVTLTDNGAGRVTVASSAITLKTNGTPNGSQTLFNAVAGSNMTITDNGSGSVTFASASASFAASANVATLPIFAHASAGLNNFTVVLRIPASYVQAFTANGFKVGLVTTALTGLVVNSATIGKTLPGSTVWVGGSPIAFTWPGGSFASANTLYFSNTCALAGDANHDYYIMIYFDPSSFGGDAYATEATTSGGALTAAAFLYAGALSGFIAGNHTADANASSVSASLTTGNMFCVQQILTA